MAEKNILMHVRRKDSGTPANDYDVLYPKTLDRLVMDEDGVDMREKLNTKLDAALYTAGDILGKLQTVDGEGSGLDADTVDGIQGETLATLAYVNDKFSTQPVKCDLPLGTGIIKKDPYDSYYYVNPWGEVTVHAHLQREDGGPFTSETMLFMLPLGAYPSSLITVSVYGGSGAGYGVVDLYSGNGGPGGNAIFYGEGVYYIIFDAKFLAYR